MKFNQEIVIENTIQETNENVNNEVQQEIVVNSTIQQTNDVIMKFNKK
jgi:hypothetical protein